MVRPLNFIETHETNFFDRKTVINSKSNTIKHENVSNQPFKPACR